LASVDRHRSRPEPAAASQGGSRSCAVRRPRAVAASLCIWRHRAAATARIPPRAMVPWAALEPMAMALRIGDIADISQLLDCPWRRRKQSQRTPSPHYRRRHIAGSCSLPYREDGAVLNLLTPTHHAYGSGLHRSPSHRSFAAPRYEILSGPNGAWDRFGTGKAIGAFDTDLSHRWWNLENLFDEENAVADPAVRGFRTAPTVVRPAHPGARPAVHAAGW
jgi:hypothetical protein